LWLEVFLLLRRAAAHLWPVMAEIVHRPAVFNNEERYPLRLVHVEQQPCTENKHDRFDNPENGVEDLLVAGMQLVVRDVF
jgi:hypothetical protein